MLGGGNSVVAGIQNDNTQVTPNNFEDNSSDFKWYGWWNSILVFMQKIQKYLKIKILNSFQCMMRWAHLTYLMQWALL